MPQRAKRPCRHPGCPNTHRNVGGYCDVHVRQARAYDEYRPSRSKRGYTRRWYRARAHFLAENPLCVECLKEDRTTAATVVDHIIPHKGDMRLFWDRSKWQSLCKPHHDAKTARETRGRVEIPGAIATGNPDVGSKAIKRLADAGFFYDPDFTVAFAAIEAALGEEPFIDTGGPGRPAGNGAQGMFGKSQAWRDTYGRQQ